MARVGLAWDLGAGRGHAVRLVALARRLRDRGDEPVLFARNLRTLRAAFDADVPRLLPAPHNAWVPRDVAPASWADVLWSEGGLHDEAQAIAIALAWRDLFDAARVERVLLDAAPLAAPVARALGLRSVAIGTGFLVPPPGPSWPVFRSWEAVDAGRLAAREAMLRERIRAVHAALDLPSGDTLEPADAAALFTHRELDHYLQRAATAHYVGPMLGRGEAPRWPHGEQRVFVYLPATHPLLPALHDALSRMSCVVLAHLGGAAPWPGTARLHVAPQPVDIAQTLSQATMAISPGGNLAIAAAARGVPSLLLPTHAESFITAMRLAGLGAATACTDAQRLDDALRQALDPAVALAARRLAATLDTPDDGAIADRVLALLA